MAADRYRVEVSGHITIKATSAAAAKAAVEKSSGLTARWAQKVIRCKKCGQDLVCSLFEYCYCQVHCPHKHVVYTGTGDDVCQDCGSIW